MEFAKSGSLDSNFQLFHIAKGVVNISSRKVGLDFVISTNISVFQDFGHAQMNRDPIHVLRSRPSDIIDYNADLFDVREGRACTIVCKIDLRPEAQS